MVSAKNADKWLGKETFNDSYCISQALSIDWSQLSLSVDIFQLFEWSLQYNRFIAVFSYSFGRKSSTHNLLNEFVYALNGKLKKLIELLDTLQWSKEIYLEASNN